MKDTQRKLRFRLGDGSVTCEIDLTKTTEWKPIFEALLESQLCYPIGMEVESEVTVPGWKSSTNRLFFIPYHLSLPSICEASIEELINSSN